MTVAADRLDPERINESWLISRKGLAIYRLLALIFVLYTILYTLAYSSIARHLLFATHWNALLILLFFILGTITDWNMVKSRALIVVTFIVFETSVSIAFTIVALYWGAINPSRQFESVNLALSSVQNHGIVSALIYIDLFLNNAIVKARDVIYPIAFAILYLPVNAAWTTITNRPIYPQVDWKRLWTFYVIVIALALIIIVHLTVWFVTYILRPGHDVEETAGEPGESKAGEPGESKAGESSVQIPPSTPFGSERECYTVMLVAFFRS